MLMSASCQCPVVLQVTPPHPPTSNPPTPTLTPQPLPAAPCFLRSLQLSSLCLGCLEDVTWPTAGKHSCLSPSSKACIVFCYRCLKIAAPPLSCFYFSRRVSQPPSLSNKMSPHKMNNKSLEARRVSDFLSGADVLNSGLREREREKLFVTWPCRHAPSAPSGVSIPERRIYLVNINTHFFGPAWKLDPS